MRDTESTINIVRVIVILNYSRLLMYLCIYKKKSHAIKLIVKHKSDSLSYFVTELNKCKILKESFS